ncbi:MAG: type II toxin-antitoxin system Phd/YefM family antitoxin [Syntrophomonadaceae bacterium]
MGTGNHLAGEATIAPQVTCLMVYHNYDKLMIITKEVSTMAQIRPISDLRNNFTEISRIVHEEGEPVFLTKHGYGDMVVMSIEQFEALKKERRIDAALQEAQKEALENPTRYNFDEVSSKLRRKLIAKVDGTDA